MTQPFRDRPNALPWPPMIYLAAVALGWLLQQVDPFDAMDQALAMLPRTVGLALFTAGVGLDFWAFLTLRRARTTVLPTAGAKALVTDGPYRFSRNPIYLGNTVALAAFAVALRWGWLLLLLPVTVAAVNWLGIAREEEHLAARFGADWTAYAAKVRRWL